MKWRVGYCDHYAASALPSNRIFLARRSARLMCNSVSFRNADGETLHRGFQNVSKTNVKLGEPIMAGDQKITEVTLRRPKVKDLRALNHLDVNANDLTRGIEMAAILTGLAPETIDELDAADFAAISDVIAGFLPKPPEPGGGARS